MTLAELRATYDTATKELDAPLAVIDLPAFDANAADMVRRADGKPIRLASKAIRCRELIARALATPGYRGVLAYSLAEALWLWRTGTCRDVVVGYPSVDSQALRELAADEDARGCVTLMVDSTEHLDVIDAVLGPNHPELRVCLELDAAWHPFGSSKVHVGALRSPVHEVADAAAFAHDVVARGGFTLVGVLAYEGQIAGIGDLIPTNPAKALAVRRMQQGSAAELVKRRTAAVRAVRAMADLEFVNGGGTGSIEGTAAEPAVTEIAAGSGLVGPTLFDGYRAFRPRPAAAFALPVVRRPGPGIVTLGYGGYVASGPPGRSRLPSPYLPPGLRLVTAEAAGEVQTPVRGAAADHLRIGDKVWFRHAKAGELAERFDAYQLIDDAGQLQTVPTYRGEGKNFG